MVSAALRYSIALASILQAASHLYQFFISSLLSGAFFTPRSKPKFEKNRHLNKTYTATYQRYKTSRGRGIVEYAASGGSFCERIGVGVASAARKVSVARAVTVHQN